VRPMRAAVVVVALALGLSAGAHAFERGETCTLKAPLLITINTPAGTLETTLDPGGDVEVLAVGDEGRLRVGTGDAKGSVATRDLEAACAGTLQMCRLSQEMLVFEKNRSDSKSWKLKAGAPVSVLRTGKVWAHVWVTDIEAFAKVDDLRPRCPLNGGGGAVKETGAEPVTEEVDRGDGPGVLFLPFLVEDGAPIGIADQLADVFFDRLAVYRPDAARLADDGDRTTKNATTWRKHVTERAARARGAGLAYVVVAKVGVAPKDANAGAAAGSGLVVSLVIVDAKTGTTVGKGLRARPSGRADDPWADTLLYTYLPLLRQAPGARLPPAPKASATTTPTSTTPSTSPTSPTSTTASIGAEPVPWFANPWGYVALSGAVAAGAAAGVVGNLATVDNAAANAAAPVDPERRALRESAFVNAVAADSLAVVAGVAAVTSVAVFATRAGIPD
jgi:hypothetical protein